MEVSNSFLQRRGSTLQMSPLDWQLISEWELQQIPLRVVCRAINDVFDKYHEQPKKKQRPVKSIAYCADEIETAFDNWCELQVGK